MNKNTFLTALVVLFLLAASAAAQNATLNFATFPDGTQVPASDVSTATFQPGSVLTDQFAPFGVHFNNTGILSNLVNPADGSSTHPDGWCSTGGYTCTGSNIVVVNSPSGGQSFDTLKITFVPQTSVLMDIDNAYLGESTQTTLQIKFLGNLVATLTLTAANEVAACPNSQSNFELCGRFRLSAPNLQPFDEIDILPTTIAGATSACTANSGVAGDFPSCGGSLIDNLTFVPPATPLAMPAVCDSHGTCSNSSLAFCAGDTAVFDGTASMDLAGGSLTYSWADVLDNPPLFSSTLTGATASTTIPNRAGEYTVQLTVTDLFNLSGKANVLVGVHSSNQAPVAQAASPGTVTSGSTVMLDGTNSYDPDGDPISYQWTQTGGPVVVLTNATTAQMSFTAPPVTYPSTVTLTFQLSVTDNPSSSECGGPLTSTANVNVTVEGVNHAPVANPGTAQTVVSTSKVTLNGSASSDPDGDLISYLWTQTGGTSVTLLNPTAPMPTFIAPQEAAGSQETLTFQLTVTDQPAPGYTALSTSASVNVTVQDPYAAPDCSKAVASQTTLWPPDHRMVGPLSILNTTDNAPGRVTITTASITQDEPTSGLGSGDTSPDAVINSDGTFFVRAERAGAGNGRVYHINFSASNGYGGKCTGTVTVCVPHDMGKGSMCVDEGPLYNSTQ